MNETEARTYFGLWSAEVHRQRKAGAGQPGVAAWEVLAKDLNYEGGAEQLRKDYYQSVAQLFPNASRFKRVGKEPEAGTDVVTGEHPYSTLGLTKTVEGIAGKVTERVVDSAKAALRTAVKGETTLLVLGSQEEADVLKHKFASVIRTLKWGAGKPYVWEQIRLASFAAGRRVVVVAVTRLN